MLCQLLHGFRTTFLSETQAFNLFPREGLRPELGYGTEDSFALAVLIVPTIGDNSTAHAVNNGQETTSISHLLHFLLLNRRGGRPADCSFDFMYASSSEILKR